MDDTLTKAHRIPVEYATKKNQENNGKQPLVLQLTPRQENQACQ
jgi:hypothetical protein